MKNLARFSKVSAPKNLDAVKFVAPRNPAEQPTCQYCQGNCDGVVDEGFSATACVSLACTGTGMVYEISNDCLVDYGTTAGGDSLQVYCVDGIARFCLSREACPWRAGTTTTAAVTCTRSGLASDAIGTASCQQWRGHNNYSCDLSGRVYFP